MCQAYLILLHFAGIMFSYKLKVVATLHEASLSSAIFPTAQISTFLKIFFFKFSKDLLSKRG
jgi:hypothetical protein